MRLPELQQLCLERFAAGDAVAPGALEAQISEGSIAKLTRIAVYENNFSEIVTGALRNVYPTIEQLVGAACFRSLARSYLQDHTSHSGDLQSYGHAFPALLDQIYSTSEHAFLGDVARLEFALDECLTAENLSGISGEQLQEAIGQEDTDIRLLPNPSLHLIESAYPILEIWRAHRNETTEKLSLDTGAQLVVVVRATNDAQMTLVSATGAKLIGLLAKDQSIDDALSQLGDSDDAQLVQALRDIVASGAFSAISVRSSV